ncbi:hypothetical protein BJX64DRAFT_246495 [Aspergillus heterothallicus]
MAWILNTFSKIPIIGVLTCYTDYSDIRIGAGLGSIRILRGVQALISPGSQYIHHGLPLEGSGSVTSKSPSGPQEEHKGTISPLIYTKGIRDIGFGIALFVVSASRDQGNMTLLLGVAALMSLADLVVAVVHGGRRSGEPKAGRFLHLFGAVYLGVVWWLRYVKLEKSSCTS